MALADFDIIVGHFQHAVNESGKDVVSDPMPIGLFASMLTASHYVKLRSAYDRDRYYYLQCPNPATGDTVSGIFRTYRGGEQV